jgi:hypothetical protein
MTDEQAIFWNRIESLIDKNEASGLTGTEAAELRIKATIVIYHPQDWNSYDVETCKMIVDAMKAGSSPVLA